MDGAGGQHRGRGTDASTEAGTSAVIWGLPAAVQCAATAGTQRWNYTAINFYVVKILTL